MGGCIWRCGEITLAAQICPVTVLFLPRNLVTNILLSLPLTEHNKECGWIFKAAVILK